MKPTLLNHHRDRPHHSLRKSAGLVCLPLLALLHVALTAAPSTALNFLLLVSDDQRPDTIRALGNATIDTPHLDALVRSGATFPRAIAAIPHCVPSRAEIMTGATGFRNGSPPFGRAIKPAMALLANSLRQAGYHTWYAGKWMNDGTPKTRGYEETSGLFSSGGAGGATMTQPTAHNGQVVTGYKGWTFKDNAGKAELRKAWGSRGPRTSTSPTARSSFSGESPPNPSFSM